MSITALTEEAMELGSYFITVAFLDEDGAAVIPNAGTIFWTLTNNSGTVINGRDYEAEASAASITIELEGADLAVQTGEKASLLRAASLRRRVIVTWEYDSDLGNDKPGNMECAFMLRNLTRIPAEIVAAP